MSINAAEVIRFLGSTEWSCTEDSDHHRVTRFERSLGDVVITVVYTPDACTALLRRRWPKRDTPPVAAAILEQDICAVVLRRDTPHEKDAAEAVLELYSRTRAAALVLHAVVAPIAL
jgi:hypothetical protein